MFWATITIIISNCGVSGSFKFYASKAITRVRIYSHNSVADRGGGWGVGGSSMGPGPLFWPTM